ncbi:MAG: hypothetical protein FJW39_07450 [Acidobacteria bacterium]|nr:hypothetical protein [Acidobacteriota bacterium]
MSQPILLVFDAPGATAAQYDAIIRDLEAAGESAPRGRTFHAAAATADGWQVIDVWESQADFDRFAKTLGPLIQTHMADSRVAPKFYPVHRRIAGVAATGVKPYILAVKMTGPVAEYDTTVARLQAEAGGVPFPGRSYHVCGLTPDGCYIVGVFESSDDYERFANKVLRRVIAQCMTTPPAMTLSAIHNRILG